MNPTQIKEGLAARVESEAPPRPDLERVVERGQRLRLRRRATAGVAVLAAGAVVAGALALAVGGDGSGTTTAYDPVGRLDVSGGLRAFASPDGGEVHLGGRTFTDHTLPFLDTDAIATEAGLVFYRSGSIYLLDANGEYTQIGRAAEKTGSGIRPTSKADSTVPWVAFGLPSANGVEIVVHDLAAEAPVASQEFACGDCSAVEIDALDGGEAFVRTGEGTFLWDVAAGTVEPFATGDTRVADVRNGVVLYDGPPPPASAVTDRFRLVPGAVDAQLTFDGRHVLSWSSRLEPTTPGDPPLRLDQPDPATGYAFWNVDTDGSIMVAVPRRDQRADVYDCELPAGTCEPVGRVGTASGDPMFIGNDM